MMHRRHLSRTRKPLIESLEGRQLLSTTIFGVTVNNQLVQFNAESASIAANPLQITGMANTDEQIVGIDVRPSNGQLYALSQRYTGTGLEGEGRIYTVNPSTGAASLLGSTPFTLNGEGYDMDIVPGATSASERVRVMSNTEQNIDINPDTGGFTERDPLNYKPGDPVASPNPGLNPNVSGIAFTGNFTDPSIPRVLYGIDTGTDHLVRIDDINSLGDLNSIGSGLGVDVEFVGFDIGNGDNAPAYAAITAVGSTVTNLYTVDVNTGAATLVGQIGGIGTVREIAVLPPAVQFSSPTLTWNENGGTLTVTVARVNGATGGSTTVQYATSAISATPGIDYTETSGTLTFAAGQETASFTVPIADDADIEGVETFQITLSNATNNTAIVAPGSTMVSIRDNDSGVVIQPEPPGGPGAPNIMTIVGTDGDDLITFLKRPRRQIEVFLNNTSQGLFDQPPAILVLGGAGNDTINFMKSKVAVRIYGEAGNDTITGSNRDDIISGGAGNDSIFARSGRDIVLAGDGADSLDGSGGEDILVGGVSTLDDVGGYAATSSLLATWSARGKYANKVLQVTDLQAALGTGTVTDDGDVDSIFGAGGNDLLFADTDGAATDALTKVARKEFVVDL